MARVLFFVQLLTALVVVPLLPGLDSRYLVWSAVFLGLVSMLPLGAVLAVYGRHDTWQAMVDAWSVERNDSTVARSLKVWELAAACFPVAGVVGGLMALVGPLTQWSPTNNPIGQALRLVLFMLLWSFLGLLTSRILGEVIRGLVHRSTVSAPHDVELTVEIASQFGLTAREVESARCLLDGLTYRDAAEHLSVAPSTVKSHILSVYQKTGTGNKVELLRLVEAESRRIHQKVHGLVSDAGPRLGKEESS